MPLLLAGDIGGTKTILRLVHYDDAPTVATPPTLKTQYQAQYASADFPDLVPLVNTFLAAAGVDLGTVQRACFGIAGPVVDNSCQLTNLGWYLEAGQLARQLHLERVELINDFAAIGYGIPGLAADDLHTLQPGIPVASAPIAIIGAGTGLGQGFAMPDGQRYRVFATEGGHADFAPRSEQEFRLLQYLKDKHQVSRVSVERVVSGQGVLSIYSFLRDSQALPELPEVAAIVRQWEQELGGEKTVDPAAAISAAALAQRDPLSERTMHLFVEAYGAETGNLALKFLPYGGLFIAGGIAAKNLPLFQTGEFMRAFSDKGRMVPILEKIPVHIVLNPQVGLIGAALCAAQL